MVWNVISKSTHSQNFDVFESAKLMLVVINFSNGIKNALQGVIPVVTELANDLQTEPEFRSVKRVGYLKGRFHYDIRE